MAFSQAWSQKSSRRRSVERQLPRLYDLGEDDFNRDDTDGDPQADNGIADLNDGLNQGITYVSMEIKLLQKELLEGMETIGKQISELKSQQDHEAELRIRMQKELTEIRRKRLFAYLPLGLLGLIIWLLYGAK